MPDVTYTGWSCIGGPAEFVDWLVERGEEVSYEEFAANVDVSTLPLDETQFEVISTDEHVTWMRTELPSGAPAWVMQHSGIEYLCLAPGIDYFDEAQLMPGIQEWMDDRYDEPWAQDWSEVQIAAMREKFFPRPSTASAPRRIAFYRGRIAGPQEQELERLFADWLPSTRFAGEVFAVGGYVRDELIGAEPHDLDIVVEQMYGAQRFADALVEAFPASVADPVPVSLDFPIWKTRFTDDVEYDGSVYSVAGADLDIADTQTMIDLDGVASTLFGGLDDDVLRRDFTANMLFKDLTTGEIVDPSGDGVEAIEEGVLRPHPEVDPGERFRQQPKQMLRAVRFMLRYDWELDDDIEAALRDNADALALISRRSVEKELRKLRAEGNLEAAMRLFIDFGFLPYLRDAARNV